MIQGGYDIYRAKIIPRSRTVLCVSSRFGYIYNDQAKRGKVILIGSRIDNCGY